MCKDWEQEEQEQRIGNCFSLPFFFIDLTRIINLYKQGVTFEDLYHKEETKFIWNATFLVLSLHRKAHNDTHVIPLELLELL